MIERISLEERNQKEKVYVKSVRLISEEVANTLGIHSEGPVFISSMTDGMHSCNHCDQVYSPLIYQAGMVTTAQHFHPNIINKTGGIYLQEVNNITDVVLNTTVGDASWLARASPLGERSEHMVWKDKRVSSEAAEILSIEAYEKVQGELVPITGGYLVEIPTVSIPFLAHVPSDYKESNHYLRHLDPVLRFRAKQGAIYFSEF